MTGKKALLLSLALWLPGVAVAQSILPTETTVKDQFFRDIPASQLMVQVPGAPFPLPLGQILAGALTPAIPGAPASVTVVAGAGVNTVSGAAVVAYPAVSGYSVFRGTASGAESGTALATNVPLPYADNAVTNGTTYYYKLKAVNAQGTSPLSTAEGIGTPNGAIIARSAVQSLAAGTITSTSIQFAWTAPATGTPPFTYKVEQSPDGSTGWATLAAAQSGVSYTATALAASTAYYFRVTAANSAGAGPVSTVLTASTSAAPLNTRARFAQDVATAGASSPAALLASMTIVTGPTTDRNGTMSTTSDQTKYTWVAVTQAAAGSGEHFYDGTGFGGFNGAASASIYTGADSDPTTIHQTYTDGNGTVWSFYRSSGHSVTLTFTLS